MKLSYALLMSTALLFSACDSDTGGKTKASAQRGALTGLGKDSEYIVETAGAFAGVNQVVIGGFKVGFLEQTRTSLKDGDGSSTTDVRLKGVDTADRQRIADAAYGDFIARLQKRGYKVIERTALIENRDYSKANRERSPLREETTFGGEDAVIRYVAPRGIEGIYFTNEAGRSGGFGFSNPQIAAINFAKENKTPVLFVTYRLNFTDHAVAKETSQIEVMPEVTAIAGSSVRVVGGQGSDFESANGQVSLAAPVSTDARYGEVIDTTSRTTRGLESASNLFSSVLGGGKNKTRMLEVQANAEKYKAASLKVLAKANDKLTAKIEALR